MEYEIPAKLENFKPLFQKYVYEAMEFNKLLPEAYYKDQPEADTQELSKQ